MVFLSELNQLVKLSLLIFNEIVGDVVAEDTAQRLADLKVDHEGHSGFYNLRHISVSLYGAVHFVHLALKVPEPLLEDEELLVLHLYLLHAFFLDLQLFKDRLLRFIPCLHEADLVGIHLILQLLFKGLQMCQFGFLISHIRPDLCLIVGQVAGCIGEVLVKLGAQVQVFRVAFERNVKEFLLLFLVQRKLTLQLIEIIRELFFLMLDHTVSDLVLFLHSFALFIDVVYFVFHK